MNERVRPKQRIRRPFGAVGVLWLSALLAGCGSEGSGGPSAGTNTGGSPGGSAPIGLMGGTGAGGTGATQAGASSLGSAGRLSGGAFGVGGSFAGLGGARPAGGASTGSGGTTQASAGAPGGSGGSAAGGLPNPTAGDGGSGGSSGAAPGGSGGGSEVTCPSNALKSGNSTQSIQAGGASRSFVLHVPSAYDGKTPVPLVLDFHGLGGSGDQEQKSSPYPAQTDPDGVIMAFPSGQRGPSGNAWNVGPCCVANVDDVALAKAIVEQVKETACIDPKRVYAVGFSMGGGLSHYLACHAADVFAAVAPAAFDLLEENQDDCKPSRPIPVISFRGTSDPIVSYEGGYSAVVPGMAITFLGAKSTLAKWAALNGCTGSPSAMQGASGCEAYSTCEGGVEVALCTKQGGSHEAGNASVGWPFLKRFTLP